MKQLHRVLKTLAILLAPLALAACKHTLEVEGQGDIIELVNGNRGCSLEEFQAGFPRCTDNEVTGDERAVYRALPRPGWRFSHWDGICEPESPGDDCEHNYQQRLVEIWEEKPRKNPLPSLRAVFTQDGDTLSGLSYIASEFGGAGSSAYATLLDALLTADGDFRYTSQQFGTRGNFERRPTNYQIQSDGQVVLRNSQGNWVSGGAATASADLVTLVDTDSGNTDLSVAFLQTKRSRGENAQFQGQYHCGHISTRISILGAGYARFFRATLDGNGNGVFTVLADRWGQSGSSSLSYEVRSDGTAWIQYVGLQIWGSLSEDGSIFTSSEFYQDGKGAMVCLKASSNQRLATVAGQYYGAWVQIDSPLLTGVTDLAVSEIGVGSELFIRTSERQSYTLPVSMSAFFNGELETRYREGAISPDGRTMFLIETNEAALPNIALYIRKN